MQFDPLPEKESLDLAIWKDCAQILYTALIEAVNIRLHIMV